MPEQRDGSNQRSELRRRAEKALRARPQPPLPSSPERLDELVHELRTHQIELELQNEELRSAQEELLQSRDDYADLYEFAPVGYVTLDEHGLIRKANLTVAELLGADRGWLVGQPLSRFPLASDQSEYYKLRRALLDTQERRSCELRLQRGDAEVFWASLDGSIVPASRDRDLQIRLTVTNIDRRKQLEEARARSEERLRTTLQSISEAVVVTDTKGLVTDINPNAERLAGRFLAQARGTPLDSFLSARAPGFREFMMSVLEADASVRLQAPLEIQLGDGSACTIAASGARIVSRNGEAQGAVFVLRDVTQELLLQAQLQQSQKMRLIGQLAGGIAHNFNNLLTVIMGNAELMQQFSAPGSEHATASQRIHQASCRARDLTRQLLTFSRSGTVERKCVDVHALIEEVATMLRCSIDRRISIELDLAAEASHVNGDHAQLQSALLNLGVNARDAMPDGGRLQFSTLNVDDSGKPAIEIRVEDTGCGIPGTEMKKIFEPFFTTKAVGRGTGLGLAEVHGCVNAHGGTIAVHSDLGRGTTFTVRLPTGTLREPEEDVVTRPVTGEGRVLVIDDEEGVLSLAKTVLERLGYEVETNASPLDAIDDFRARPGRFDLVILDLTMPLLSGRETLRRLREADDSVPIVIHSGYSDSTSISELRAAGAADYLNKPYSIRELALCVSRLVGGSGR